MNRMFTMKDIERMCRETGVSREEAVWLLRRAGGDYKEAMKNYISGRNACVEPLRVEDNERGAHVFMQKLLHEIRLFMGRSSVRAWAAALVVIMLALAAAPKVTACALLITLFLRCGLNLFMGRQTATII